MERWKLEAAYGKLLRENDELRERLGRQAAEMGDLRQLIEDQRAEIAALKAEVEELRRSGHRQANRFGRDKDRLSKDPKRPGRKAGQGKWSRGAEPTEEQKAKAETKTSCLAGCPDCGSAVTDVQRHEHYEVDIPPVEPKWTRFESESGYCPDCGRRVRSRHPDQISEATGAAGVVVGPHAKALASDMKHHLGLSYGKISAFFAVAFGLSFQRSGIYRADMRLAARASPVYAELVELVRQLAQVHVDETGWRIGALSAWLWVFCGSGITVYTIRTSRGHEVVLDILGQSFRGYLTSDGLLTYDAAALSGWLKQKCLAHILRRLKELSASQRAAHVALATGLTAVLRDALELARQRDELDGLAYAEAAKAIEQRLDTLIAEHLSEADDDGARMARHLNKHRMHLLPFLHVAGLAATNNEAERELRPGVVTRRAGRCNRTEAAAAAHAVLASIGATCRRRGIPVLDFLVQLQRSTNGVPSIAAATPAPSGR
jgi:hypothetical protein